MFLTGLVSKLHVVMSCYFANEIATLLVTLQAWCLTINSNESQKQSKQRHSQSTDIFLACNY